ncbi:hypothetical protein HDV01_001517 [Terramyces sp. JEL0728]|nr:hypothetical protein HDV01_001517 [Terramyces sp. JEL0728]
MESKLKPQLQYLEILLEQNIPVEFSSIGEIFYDLIKGALPSNSLLGNLQAKSLENLNFKFQVVETENDLKPKLEITIISASILEQKDTQSKDILSIGGSGYHPKFNFKVEEDSQILIYVPRDYFVDPYEIEKIMFDSSLDFTLSGNVDLEVPRPSNDARPHILDLAVLGSKQFQIPFHMRYQEPSSSHDRINVEIISPIVYNITADPCEGNLVPRAIKNLIHQNDFGCLTSEFIGKQGYIAVPVGNRGMERKVAQYTFINAVLGSLLLILVMLSTLNRNKLKID